MPVRRTKPIATKPAVTKPAAVKQAAKVDVAALQRAVSDVNKFFRKSLGGDALAIAADVGLGGRPAGHISTGCVLLDLYMRGGIPLGKIIEVFGGPSVGKTTLAMAMAASCQRAGGIVQLVDSESSWSEDRAMAMGVDLATLVWSRGVRSLEDGFDVIEDSVAKVRAQAALKDVPYLVIWDTIKNAKTRSLITVKKIADRFSGGMMERPQIIGTGIQRLDDALAQHKIALVIVNQISSSLKGDDSAGGNAFKHACAQRLCLQRGYPKGTIEDSHGPIGIRVKAYLKKNKMSGLIPYERDVSFPMFWETGIDSDLASAEYLAANPKCKEIFEGGGFIRFKFDGKEVKARRLAVREVVRKNKGMRKWMNGLLRKHLLRPAATASAA